MPYMLTHFWPGGTEEQYHATAAVVHPPQGLPEGQLHHAAGPTDGGFLVAVVYDDKETADRFMQDTLIPAMPVEGGLVGPPEERSAELVYLESS